MLCDRSLRRLLNSKRLFPAGRRDMPGDREHGDIWTAKPLQINSKTALTVPVQEAIPRMALHNLR